MGAITVKLVLDDQDFEHLTQNSMQWGDGGPDWKQKIRDGRFELYGGSDGGPPVQWPSAHWKYAYWVGDSYGGLILVRAFLAAWGFDYQAAWDTAEHPNGETLGWVILTDYESPVWQRARESERRG
jgi:hypothetical protein